MPSEQFLAPAQNALALACNLEFDLPYQPIFRPKRYKVYYGGRGGAKSWSIARALLILAAKAKLRIGCFRELQNSIKDSVHRLLCDKISEMGLSAQYRITQTSIINIRTGSEFIFKGLRLNAHEIKSMEGIDIAWVEEAQLVSKVSWDLLIPTIRKESYELAKALDITDGSWVPSEIWVSFNPIDEEDDTYKRFVVNPPPLELAIIIKVNWNQNTWFPSTLDAERRYMLRTDPEGYEHVWGGNCRTISEAVIFKGKYVIDSFEAPFGTRLFFGMDFGFANDAACLTRAYITGDAPTRDTPDIRQDYWIEYAQFGYHIEIDELPKLMEKVPGAKQWPIKADNSRPETISYLRRRGFNITAAEKWQGSVEDGIEHLRGFNKIHIHQRNKEMQQEARLYRFKVDKNTEQVLPIIVDANNHGWDANRYGLDGYIHKRGVHEIWRQLAK